MVLALIHAGRDGIPVPPGSMHEIDYSTVSDRFDWGRATMDYARYRPVPPASFYRRLEALGMGLAGQRILDLGTGLGPLARQFASQGCTVLGIDTSPEQIAMARHLAPREALNLDFQVIAASRVVRALPGQHVRVKGCNACVASS